VRCARRLRGQDPYLLLSAIPLIVLVVSIAAFAVDVPIADQWALVPLLEKSYAGRLSLRDLWAQHNEHRLLFPRLLMLGLAHLTGWNTAYELGANVVFSAVIAWLLGWQACVSARRLGVDARPLLPIIALAPVVPPLAFVFLLAWRLMRPGLLPLWAGLPLGAFDDLFSGQPFGSGILLFSLTMMGIELLDMRFPWRSFWQDWIIAIALMAAYLVLAAILSGARLDRMELVSLAPQFLLAIVAYPVIARIVSLLDRLRLLRVRRLG